MTADATNLRIIGQMRKLTQGGRAAPRSVPEPLYWEPELLGRWFVVVVRHIDVLGEPRCPDASEVDSLGLADDDVLVPLRPCGEDRVCEYVSSRVEFRRELRNNLWELITYERRLPVEWPWPLLSVAEGYTGGKGRSRTGMVAGRNRWWRREAGRLRAIPSVGTVPELQWS